MMSPVSPDPDTSGPDGSASSLRERNVEGRRQQILQAALLLLRREGLLPLESLLQRGLGAGDLRRRS